MPKTGKMFADKIDMTVNGHARYCTNLSCTKSWHLVWFMTHGTTLQASAIYLTILAPRTIQTPASIFVVA